MEGLDRGDARLRAASIREPFITGLWQAAPAGSSKAPKIHLPLRSNHYLCPVCGWVPKETLFPILCTGLWSKVLNYKGIGWYLGHSLWWCWSWGMDQTTVNSSRARGWWGLKHRRNVSHHYTLSVWGVFGQSILSPGRSFLKWSILPVYSGVLPTGPFSLAVMS